MGIALSQRMSSSASMVPWWGCLGAGAPSPPGELGRTRPGAALLERQQGSEAQPRADAAREVG